MKLYDNPYIRYIALLLIYFGTIYYYKDSRTVKGVLYFTALFLVTFSIFYFISDWSRNYSIPSKKYHFLQ